MKYNILGLGTLLVGAVMLGSCSLDETPKSKFDEKDAYANSTLIYVNSVANVYSAIGNSIYGDAGAAVHTLQEFTSDATMLPGRQGDWVDGGKWQNFFLHNFASSVDTYNNVGSNLYKVVGLCNSSIDKLQGLAETVPASQDYIYELRALRAIFYYYLMDLYGQIPLVTSSSVSTSDVAQSNRSKVFEFVTSELADCIPHLSDQPSQKSGEYYGRVTKAVAYMCMAKCALNAPVYTIDNTSETSYQDFVGTDKTGKNTVSESLGEKVSTKGKSISITVDGQSRNAWETVVYCVDQIAALGYSLQPKYADNFIVQNENSVENIFTRPDDDQKYKINDDNLKRSLHYNHAGAMGYSGWNGACASTFEMQVGLDTKGHDGIGLACELKALCYDAAKLGHVEHNGIAWCHHDVGFGVLGFYAPAYIGNARCGVASAWLKENVLCRYFWQLFTHNLFILFVGHYPHVLARTHSFKTVVCELNERTSYAKHVDKLLGAVTGAHRPYSAAYTTCHYYQMIACMSHKCK